MTFQPVFTDGGAVDYVTTATKTTQASLAPPAISRLTQQRFVMQVIDTVLAQQGR